MSALMHQALLATYPYRAHAVTFDGTNDYLRRGADLTGAADGKQLTVSYWLKPNADGAFETILEAPLGTARLQLFKRDINSVSLVVTNTAGSIILNVRCSTTFTVANGWRHYMVSVDLTSTSLRHLYVNDASDLATVTTYTNADMDLTHSNWSFGGNITGDSMNCDIADFLMWPTYIDLSTQANRRLFISSAGKPANPAGAIASLGAPIIGLYGAPTSTWHTNKGSGGGFTLTGALADAATSP